MGARLQFVLTGRASRENNIGTIEPHRNSNSFIGVDEFERRNKWVVLYQCAEGTKLIRINQAVG